MTPNRIVIDTNVCLDLFVFRDPRWARLHAGLLDGSVDAVTRADCRTEWLIVLEYRHLPLDAAARQKSREEFDTLIRCLPHAPSDAASRTDIPIKLPLCRDPDDQKFLEVARDASAAVLLTKDKALLKLARWTRRAGMFAILPPEAWSPVSVYPASPLR